MKKTKYSEIAKKMLFNLQKIPDENIILVSGPISTGGFGSVKENLIFFKKAIERLKSNGYIVFDQMPFEDEMEEIWRNRKAASLFKNYDWDLLYECYLPLFKSGLIGRVIFLPDYENSIGAQWEEEMCYKYNIKIMLFEEMLLLH